MKVEVWECQRGRGNNIYHTQEANWGARLSDIINGMDHLIPIPDPVGLAWSLMVLSSMEPQMRGCHLKGPIKSVSSHQPRASCFRATSRGPVVQNQCSWPYQTFHIGIWKVGCQGSMHL